MKPRTIGFSLLYSIGYKLHHWFQTCPNIGITWRMPTITEVTVPSPESSSLGCNLGFRVLEGFPDVQSLGTTALQPSEPTENAEPYEV